MILELRLKLNPNCSNWTNNPSIIIIIFLHKAIVTIVKRRDLNLDSSHYRKQTISLNYKTLDTMSTSITLEIIIIIIIFGGVGGGWFYVSSVLIKWGKTNFLCFLIREIWTLILLIKETRQCHWIIRLLTQWVDGVKYKH